ncbi:hypothetical protein NQ317_019323 [Molorchus minor]|uniref:Uncharacterized protein n=1 Tax=Molorchus minor TaxID=1323400 RepID=A0ABQ9J4V8_9CUCU|nr:hypothetical protein NQ317_019323 [Molorchus minor]
MWDIKLKVKCFFFGSRHSIHFLKQCPDRISSSKVALIIGISGACR